MLIPATLIILSPFLKGVPFQLSKNASHTPSFINIISGHKPCRTILNLFLVFLKLTSMRVPDRAAILQDWTHHTFISCFFHILGAGEKSSPQETNGSISFSANIADKRIPFQIICMLDHPITMVLLNLNVFDTLKVYKFMSIQTQKEHIGHIKQSKRVRFQDRYFFSQAKHGCTNIFPKTENLTLIVVFIYSYVISSSCILC